MLTLHPGPTQPVREASGAEELLDLWRGLDADGRRLILANARAVAEVGAKARRAAVIAAEGRPT